MIKGLSHIGIAVKDLEKAVETYKSAFGLDASATIESPSLRVSMIKVGECHVELLQPTTTEGPIAKFIEKRNKRSFRLISVAHFANSFFISSSR